MIEVQKKNRRGKTDRQIGADEFGRNHHERVDEALNYLPGPLCKRARREFPLRLHEPHNVVRCTECGLYYLYPRLIESAMQEAYRESSFYEGGACGYADTPATLSRNSSSGATFKRLLHDRA
ncbi:MAG TPA: hypothetical protein VFA61_11305 [Candidatus Udaeobacter sp.]|nr:hypothetical protein [Candidatus Udaeobacter sp.]